MEEIETDRQTDRQSVLDVAEHYLFKIPSVCLGVARVYLTSVGHGQTGIIRGYLPHPKVDIIFRNGLSLFSTSTVNIFPHPVNPNP